MFSIPSGKKIWIGLAVVAGVFVLALGVRASGIFNDFLASRVAPGLVFRITAAGDSFTLIRNQDNAVEWDINPYRARIHSGMAISLCPTGATTLTRECVALRHFAENNGASSVFVPEYVSDGQWTLLLTPWHNGQMIPMYHNVFQAYAPVTVRPAGSAPAPAAGQPQFELSGVKGQNSITGITTVPADALETADFSQTVAVTLKLQEAGSRTVAAAPGETRDSGRGILGFLAARVAPGLEFKITGAGESGTMYKGEFNQVAWDTNPVNVQGADGEIIALCPVGTTSITKDCTVIENYTENDGEADVYVPPYIADGQWNLVLTPWSVDWNRPNYWHSRSMEVQVAGRSGNTAGMTVSGDLEKDSSNQWAIINITTVPANSFAATDFSKGVTVNLSLARSQLPPVPSPVTTASPQASPSASPSPSPSASPQVSPSPSASIPPPVEIVPTAGEHLIFVTSQRYAAGKDFTGLSGADQACQSEADGAGLTGTFKAVLSDSATDAKSRVNIQRPVKNTKGEVIASSGADLWDASIGATVYTPTQGKPAFPFAWSGTDSNGSKSGDSDFCSDWTQGKPAPVRAGLTAASDSRWINARNIGCRGSFHLYCVSESPADILLPEPQASPSPSPQAGSSEKPQASPSPSPQIPVQPARGQVNWSQQSLAAGQDAGFSISGWRPGDFECLDVKVDGVKAEFTGNVPSCDQ